MLKFWRCGRNDLTLLLAFSSKRVKISSVIYRLACENVCRRLLPVYSLRNVTLVCSTDSGKYEDFRKRNVTLMLLSSGLAVLALCSALQDGMFDTFGGGNCFLWYFSVISAGSCDE